VLLFHPQLVGIAMKIQEKIRLMRESRHWSQEEIAEKLGMSTNGYAKIERGESKANFSKLEQIAALFEVDLMELLSFGERHVALLIGDSNSGCNIVGSSELMFENQKLQLIIQHKDELICLRDGVIARQQAEIADLRDMVNLLKSVNS
jgi:transcriptional regulator with XRE-family HTH domain